MSGKCPVKQATPTSISRSQAKNITMDRLKLIIRIVVKTNSTKHANRISRLIKKED